LLPIKNPTNVDLLDLDLLLLVLILVRHTGELVNEDLVNERSVRVIDDVDLSLLRDHREHLGPLHLLGLAQHFVEVEPAVLEVQNVLGDVHNGRRIDEVAERQVLKHQVHCSLVVCFDGLLNGVFSLQVFKKHR
jgi:hypothetical protein